MSGKWYLCGASSIWWESHPLWWPHMQFWAAGQCVSSKTHRELLMLEKAQPVTRENVGNKGGPPTGKGQSSSHCWERPSLCCSWVVCASNGSIFTSNQATIKIIASAKAQCCQVFAFIIFPKRILRFSYLCEIPQWLNVGNWFFNIRISACQTM